MMDALANNIDTTGNWLDENGDVVSSYFQLMNPDTSVFSYHVQSTNACPSVLSNLYLNQSSELRYTISNDTTITIGESTQLFCNNGMTWSWSPSYILDCDDCQDPIASPEESTTIFLKMTDSNYCEYLDTIRIGVDEKTFLHIPTAFTPNGDGSNDHFYLSGKNICSGEFSIYNRWGKLVYRTNDIFDHWDGTYMGNLQKMEGFNLVGRIRFCDDTEEVFNTMLHLVH
jgi:gliding motility-associated-like protein